MKQQGITQKLDEVFLIEVASLRYRPLTNLYKYCTSYLKTIPFVIFVPIAFVVAVIVYSTIGVLLVRLVSTLQNGF